MARQEYEDILKRQEALKEHIEEVGHEGYQNLFVRKKGLSAGSWFMISLIAISVIALITSLPIEWGQIFG